MKCKFCGGTEFIGHQTCRMDVLVDENGDFSENLHGGADANIYDSEAPYGPFTCCGCGAEYEEIRDGAIPNSGPVEGWTRFQFKKSSDFIQKNIRRQYWRGTRCDVSLTFYENGQTNIVIQKHGGKEMAFYPKMRVEQDDSGMTLRIIPVCPEAISMDDARGMATAMANAFDDAEEIMEQFLTPIQDGTFDKGDLSSCKVDMSPWCSSGYEQMFVKLDKGVISQAEFDAWYKNNCAKCCYMNETCMAGESIEDSDKVVIAYDITRRRDCKHEIWNNTIYLTISRSEFNDIPDGAWTDDGFVKKLLLEKAARYLTTSEGWTSICNACQDYNWGDLLNDLPLPLFGLYFDKNDVAQYPVKAVCSLQVDQDELITPDHVSARWVLMKDNKTIQREAPVYVNFQDGSIEFCGPTPSDDGFAALVYLNDTGTIFECDREKGFEMLKRLDGKKELYLCTSDLVVGGVTLCSSGRLYRILDAKPGPNESAEDINGYCDIHGCDNGGVCASTWLDAGEHFAV